MAKQRIINTKFWDDSFIIRLTWKEKLLFLYLLTNPQTELCGAFELSLRKAAFDTGLRVTEVESAFTKFEAADKVIYKDDWVIIRNFAKHQIVNPKVARGVARSLAACPEWVQEIVRTRLGKSIPAHVPERVQIPKSTRLRILKRDKHRCVMCSDVQDLVIDHVRPVAVGGTNADENLRTLCRSCNGKRNAELRWSENGDIEWMGVNDTHKHPSAPITPTPKPELKPKPIGEEESHPPLDPSFDFPVKQLVDAFPDMTITPAAAGFLEAEIKPGDEIPWERTVQKYRMNHNRMTKSYLPEKTANVIEVFRAEKAKWLKEGGGNAQRLSAVPEMSDDEKAALYAQQLHTGRKERLIVVG